jgi:two-component system response regulator TctD
MRVLIVEDNAAFADIMADQLARAGIDSDRATTAAGADEAITRLDYAAVILDLGLPDRDGLDLLSAWRERGCATPVMITTARHSLEDRVSGLRAGADAYLPKPFAIPELIARLRALLRRPGSLLGPVIVAGNLSLDVEHHQVNVGGRVHPVRLREALVLELLMRHKGSVVPRRYFEDQLFGLEGEADSNTVEVYVHRLRKNLQEARASVQIHTIRGVGYLLAEKPSAPASAGKQQETTAG